MFYSVSCQAEKLFPGETVIIHYSHIMLDFQALIHGSLDRRRGRDANVSPEYEVSFSL
ncbi:hypothetical protein DESC_190115 [Desulfosarcina cetonica]|nr:hypothetical protein DESC_190115 [Desulfosarcina cetonica]